MGNKEIVVNVIGSGLAGSEACYQLIKRGIKVTRREEPVAWQDVGRERDTEDVLSVE